MIWRLISLVEGGGVVVFVGGEADDEADPMILGSLR